MAVLKAFHHQISIFFSGKNILPLHHRKGDKMNPVLVTDLIAALHVANFTGKYRNRVPPISTIVWGLPAEDSKQRANIIEVIKGCEYEAGFNF